MPRSSEPDATSSTSASGSAGAGPEPAPAAVTPGTALGRSGILAGPHPGVDELLLEARFVDHHVHGILRGRLDPERLVAQLSETDRPEAARIAGLDHQLGVAVRRWTAPLLGLEPGLPASAVAGGPLGPGQRDGRARDAA